jgi:LysM repeat protein
MGEFFDAGFQNYTVLHGNENLIPEIRSRYPDARILVRMYLSRWNEKNPADWARETADFMSRMREFTNQVTWANEQNLDLEGHPQGASPQQPIPPASLYQDIHQWNMEMIRRLRELIPWARLHYPAFANDHSDDKNQGGYTGLEICRPSIEAADVMDCHVYWRVDDGPLTLDGGQRFVLTHNFFPDKPIFISECGDFAVRDARSPEQYVTWMHSRYHYPYVEGATFFIWDSDGAEENAPNVIVQSDALVRRLREVAKDAPPELPPVPAAPPPVVIARPEPVPTEPIVIVSGGREYVVEAGDTLLAIARRFQVELVDLMNANAITDARKLRVGQRLQIPGASPREEAPTPAPGGDVTAPPVSTQPTTPPSDAGAVYIVRGGDTLSAIAKRFNVTVAAIVTANSLENPNVIRPGQRLVIPPPAMVLGVAETAAVLRAEEPAGAAVLGVGDPSTPVVSPREIETYLAGKRTTFYVTRKGDTIPKVAALFHTDALILSQVNEVGMQGEMIPGTRLIIPMRVTGAAVVQ